jgi:hypothetical protein
MKESDLEIGEGLGGINKELSEAVWEEERRKEQVFGGVNPSGRAVGRVVCTRDVRTLYG